MGYSDGPAPFAYQHFRFPRENVDDVLGMDPFAFLPSGNSAGKIQPEVRSELEARFYYKTSHPEIFVDVVKRKEVASPLLGLLDNAFFLHVAFQRSVLHQKQGFVRVELQKPPVLFRLVRPPLPKPVIVEKNLVLVTVENAHQIIVEKQSLALDFMGPKVLRRVFNDRRTPVIPLGFGYASGYQPPVPPVAIAEISCKEFFLPAVIVRNLVERKVFPVFQGLGVANVHQIQRFFRAQKKPVLLSIHGQSEVPFVEGFDCGSFARHNAFFA